MKKDIRSMVSGIPKKNNPWKKLCFLLLLLNFAFKIYEIKDYQSVVVERNVVEEIKEQEKESQLEQETSEKKSNENIERKEQENKEQENKEEENIVDEEIEEHESVSEESDEHEKTMKDYEKEGVIRVVLMTNHFSSIYHEEIVLQSDDIMYLTYGKEKKKIKEGKKLTLGCKEKYFKEEEKIYIEPEKDSGISILSLTRSEGVPCYHGKLEIRKVEDNLVMINELSLEQYLKCVVSSEMPVSFEEEALKVQAVAARTYAFNALRNPGYPEYMAHVDDSTNFQVYNNIEEREKSSKAVDDTRGKIMLYEGQPITAYYFSTSCGVTTDGRIWGSSDENNLPYIDSRFIGEGDLTYHLENENDFRKFINNKCESAYESDEPWFRWKMSIKKDTLSCIEERIRERYQLEPDNILVKTHGENYESKEPKRLGKIKNITVKQRGMGGIIEKLIIKGSKSTACIIGEYNVRYVLAGVGEEITRNNDSTCIGTSLLPSAYFYIEKVKNDCYNLVGGGFGHGAGMSQFGANEMAKTGLKYEEILNDFYCKVEIEELSYECND
ncbi:MAG: SpoIID/LytB domain-containing protein [Lachnospiraceae bacterium]|nr:SpoIID/LytB domain-containing protein [Lachnospiraceae bacterium]